MQKKHIILIFLIFVLVACSPSTPAPAQLNVETVVAETFLALTTTPAQPLATSMPTVSSSTQNTVNGIPFTFSKLSLVIPNEIASSISEEKVEGVPPSEGMPWWGVYPTHVQYTLAGYNATELSHEPEIYVYPIAEYISINEGVAENVEIIKSLSNSPDQPFLPNGLPFLPTFNAGQMFYSNFGVVSFQNGSGIRYITEFSQFPHPISNSGMLYTFQGITNDGLYYVSAVLPISIGFLVNYPTPTDQGDFVFIESEVKRVTEQLNDSSPEDFTPSMLTLDALIQSMNVTGIP